MNTAPVLHVIIAFGAGLDAGVIRAMQSRGDADRSGSIGFSTRLRALAAAAVYQRTKNALIVFSGGITADGDWISEAEAMRGCVLKERTFPVPAADIMCEAMAKDTVTNVRRTAALLKTLPLAPDADVILIAGRRQMESAVAYFRAHGIRVRPMLLREALGAHAKEFDIPGTVDAPLKPHEKRRERILKVVRLIDRRGALLSAFLRWKRR